MPLVIRVPQRHQSQHRVFLAAQHSVAHKVVLQQVRAGLRKHFLLNHVYTVAPARGGKQGGWLPPNVEKDGPRNSSKFDENIGRGEGCVSISDVKKS